MDFIKENGKKDRVMDMGNKHMIMVMYIKEFLRIVKEMDWVCTILARVIM